MELQCHKIGHKNYFDNNYFFKFSANIIRYCNYKCSYCWDSYHSKDKTDYIPGEVLDKTLKKIVDHCNKNNIGKVSISYSGGEPLRHPEIFDILRSISYYDIKIETCITTNLSCNMDFFKELVSIVKKYNINLTLSSTLHGEFINTDYKFKNYMSKLNFLKDNNIHVTVNLVMKQDTFWEQAEQATIIRDNNIPIVLKHLRDENGIPANIYDTEMINYMKEAHIDQRPSSIIWYDNFGDKHYLIDHLRTVVHNIRNYYKFSCNSGYTSVSMNFDGTMSRGYACYEVHNLGNAYNDDWELLDDAKSCEFDGDCFPCDIISIKSKEYFSNKHYE